MQNATLEIKGVVAEPVLAPSARALSRAAEYRRLADEANAIVESSPLANVREKQQLAAATWTALAMTEERSRERPARAAGT